jgi:hypothetical protein
MNPNKRTRPSASILSQLSQRHFLIKIVVMSVPVRDKDGCAKCLLVGGRVLNAHIPHTGVYTQLIVAAVATTGT